MVLGVWRIDFQIFLNFVNLEIVAGDVFSGLEGTFHVLVELAGEVVGVRDAEDSLIEVNILRDFEIFPGVEFLDSQCFRNFLTVYKDALGDAGVLDSGFGDVDGVVVEVIVNDTRSDAIVFELGLHDGFLEIAIESQDLSVVLEPGGLHPRDVVVLGGRAGSLEVGRGLGAESLQ